MLDWNNYRSELMQRLGELGKLTPETMKGVVALGNAGNKTDLLGAKVRELIALACAVTTRCDGCIAFHADAAVKAGATDAEIAEALGVLARRSFIQPALWMPSVRHAVKH
ncbi:carboxymuconolactone decarboxylase family protein [Klebsiella pneumoniae]|nr:carboxymuconolactone decarboxylase family protein [Klebsiella pneumoniae]